MLERIVNGYRIMSDVMELSVKHHRAGLSDADLERLEGVKEKFRGDKVFLEFFGSCFYTARHPIKSYKGFYYLMKRK
jgi:hypothetical protein